MCTTLFLRKHGRGASSVLYEQSELEKAGSFPPKKIKAPSFFSTPWAKPYLFCGGGIANSSPFTAKNLKSFADAIDKYVSKGIQQGIEIMTQVKIYNEKIRERHGYRFWWKQESTKFKYFRNKTDQKAFARNIDSLGRIDKTIQKEVGSAIEKAEKRSKKLAQNEETPERLDRSGH